MTEEHGPEKNDAEKERLASMGVEIDGGYVGGHVQVSELQYGQRE